MWEYSMQMSSEKMDLAKYLYTTLEGKIKEVSGVITSYEQDSHITIVLACPEMEKVRMKYIIANAISNGVCTYIKEDFLAKHLQIPVEGKLEQYTFKKALVFFDRETDKFLVLSINSLGDAAVSVNVLKYLISLLISEAFSMNSFVISGYLLVSIGS